MAILVIAEHDNQSLKASTLNTVTAAGREVSTGWVPHVPARCRVPVIV